eukprot:3742139-Rhodomonas_salina.1
MSVPGIAWQARGLIQLEQEREGGRGRAHARAREGARGREGARARAKAQGARGKKRGRKPEEGTEQ